MAGAEKTILIDCLRSNFHLISSKKGSSYRVYISKRESKKGIKRAILAFRSVFNESFEYCATIINHFYFFVFLIPNIFTREYIQAMPLTIIQKIYLFIRNKFHHKTKENYYVLGQLD